ncbi:hypothetical protein AVEN_69755-1 [Araneus ventricosus]|uniref:Uncharacterized protein n=1 Tax=Araneus ventricosus TaxID=182803 RepID=A0A4Y2CVS1_ARAVE|nr:hypothetical protein AVEN_69755-1 [Araneus ventricosus]
MTAVLAAMVMEYKCSLFKPVVFIARRPDTPQSQNGGLTPISYCTQPELDLITLLAECRAFISNWNYTTPANPRVIRGDTAAAFLCCWHIFAIDSSLVQRSGLCLRALSLTR